MICPQCKDKGRTSVVFSLGRKTTLMNYSPFWDTEGHYHHHDMNTVEDQYKCSEGHRWSEKINNKCPNPDCDWGKE